MNYKRLCTLIFGVLLFIGLVLILTLEFSLGFLDITAILCAIWMGSMILFLLALMLWDIAWDVWQWLHEKD